MSICAGQARLIIAASETAADLYYASGFLAPDAFIYLETEGRKALLMSDLELDRARSEAAVDEVLPLSQYQETAKLAGTENPSSLDALDVLLKERDIRDISVPRSFPIEAADFLRARNYRVTWSSGSFFPERERKTDLEIARIREVQRHTEAAMDAAVDVMRSANVRDGVLHHDGEALTSERVRSIIARTLMDRSCTARHTIVACGDQACDPHNHGTGPLRAGLPVVIDIFPRSDETGYYADMTRTVVKGEASSDLVDIYDAVLAAQIQALNQICAGVDGRDIHRGVSELFDSRGFSTGLQDGRMQGFFHGTGHGVGLDIHESPGVGKASSMLEPGHVVSVEPGLYYIGCGAVRIEDLVVVTETGCDNLTDYPKSLIL